MDGDLIARIAREILDQSGPLLLAGSARTNRGEAEAQAGRWPLELVQNAEDALHRSGRKGRVAFRVDGDQVLVANDGDPFSENDVRALFIPGLSGKGAPLDGGCPVCERSLAETIGHKGIGFTATRELGSHVLVSSGQDEQRLRFRLDPAEAWAPYQRRWGREIDRCLAQKDGLWAHADTLPPAWFPAAIPVPWPDPPAVVDEFHAQGYRTVFLFRGNVDGATVGPAVQEAVLHQVAPSLLFLDHVDSIEVQVAGGPTVRTSVEEVVDRRLPDGLRLRRLVHDGAVSEWYVARRRIESLESRSASRGRQRTFEWGVAVPRDTATASGFLCVHYPTDVSSGSCLHFHGDFVTDPARRNVRVDDPFNRTAAAAVARAFLSDVLPGLQELVRGSVESPRWLLSVLAHAPTAGTLSERIWREIREGDAVPGPDPLVRADIVPGRRGGRTVTLAKASGSVQMAGEGLDIARLLKDGLADVSLVDPEVLDDPRILALLQGIGVRRLGQGESLIPDLGRVARALTGCPPTGIDEACRYASWLRTLFDGRPIPDEGRRRAVRALKVFPVCGEDGTVAFLDALGHEPPPVGKPSPPDPRPWLRAEQLPEPPRWAQERVRLAHEAFQFEPGRETERPFIGWLRDSGVLRPQQGRQFVPEVAREVEAKWRRTPDDPAWPERWARFFTWAVEVFRSRKQEVTAVPGLGDVPVPAMRGPSAELCEARWVVRGGGSAVARNALKELGEAGPPVLDLARLKGWLGVPAADDADERLDVFLRMFALPEGFRFSHPRLATVDLTVPGGPALPDSGLDRPRTDAGRALREGWWRSYWDEVRRGFSSRDGIVVPDRLPVLPAWAFDVMAAGDAHRRDALFRLLDEEWRKSHDECIFVRKSRKFPYQTPARHALATLPWIPASNGRLQVARECLHVCDSTGDLHEGLLPMIRSGSFGDLETALQVQDLTGDWRVVAKVAGRLVDAPPEQLGELRGAMARNPWRQTLGGLYERLSLLLDQAGWRDHEGDIRKELHGRMPRVLAVGPGGFHAAPWQGKGLVSGLPPALTSRLTLDRPHFAFSPDRMGALAEAIGIRPFSDCYTLEPHPPWECLAPLAGEPWEGGFRELVTVALVLAGARADLARVGDLRMYWHPAPALRIGSDAQPVRYHGDREATRLLVACTEGRPDPDPLVEALVQVFPGHGLDRILAPLADLLRGNEAAAWARLADKFRVDPESVQQAREQVAEGLGAFLQRGPAGARAPAGAPPETVDMGCGTGAVPEDDEPPGDDAAKAIQVPSPEQVRDAVLAMGAGRMLDAGAQASRDVGTGVAGTAAGNRTIAPKRPNAAAGRAAEVACEVYLREVRFPGQRVHDVHDRPWFGADFVVTRPGIEIVPPGASQAQAQDWLLNNATALVECKGTTDRTGGGILLPLREWKRAVFAREHGLRYLVIVWHLVVREGVWMPVARDELPDPSTWLHAAALVQATYAVALATPGSTPTGA